MESEERGEEDKGKEEKETKSLKLAFLTRNLQEMLRM
jgi:hypothetical protein